MFVNSEFSLYNKLCFIVNYIYMKKRCLGLVSVALITALSASSALAAEVMFKDVAADHFAKSAITWASQLGLMGKNSDGTFSENFRPSDTMTRAELAIVLERYHRMMYPELGTGDAAKKVTTVIDTATKNGSLSTLTSLIKTAGLTELLVDDGPFTVFAPNNAAFDKVGAATLTDLLKTENKQKLVRLLTYHIVQGKILASDLRDGQKLKTLQGQELTVRVTLTGEGTAAKKSVTINEAKVVSADIFSDNGVVHTIETVLSPADKTTIVPTTTTPVTTTGTTTPVVR